MDGKAAIADGVEFGVSGVWPFLCDCDVGIVEDVFVDLVVCFVGSASWAWVPSIDFELCDWCVLLWFFSFGVVL